MFAMLYVNYHWWWDFTTILYRKRKLTEILSKKSYLIIICSMTLTKRCVQYFSRLSAMRAGLGLALLGLALLGLTWHGLAWLGLAWPGLGWLGLAGLWFHLWWKTCVVLCSHSKLMKKYVCYCVFTQEWWKIHWCYCVFIQTEWISIGFILWSLKNVGKPMVWLCLRSKCW